LAYLILSPLAHWAQVRAVRANPFVAPPLAYSSFAPTLSNITLFGGIWCIGLRSVFLWLAFVKI